MLSFNPLITKYDSYNDLIGGDSQYRYMRVLYTEAGICISLVEFPARYSDESA